jgi:hypothetical protein
MMKRSRNVLTVLSAVVFALSLMLAVRSCFRTDQAGAFIGRGRLWLVTVDAQLAVVWDPSAAPPLATLSPSFESHDAAKLRPVLDTVWPRMTGIRALGIGWNVRESMDERLILPLWLVPLLSAILPIRWWQARQRDGRRGFIVETVTHATET